MRPVHKVQLETYLKLHHVPGSPDQPAYGMLAARRTKIIRELVAGHPGKALALPALGEADIKKLAVGRPDQLRQALDLLDHEGMLRANLQDINLWNENLNEFDLSGAILNGANFRRAQLVDANFEGARLEDAKLQYANLTRARFGGAVLNRVDLRGATLEHARFPNATMSRADFRGATLEHAGFPNASMIGVDLRRAKLDHEADLRGADLRRARLQEADLSGANLGKDDENTKLLYAELQDAKLIGAHLQEADLSGADLRNADLTSANLQSAGLSKVQLQGSVLLDADLQKATLEKANLESAVLDKAKFQEATLRDANLQNAGLVGTNFEDADLEGAILKGEKTYLRNAKFQRANLSRANLEKLDEKNFRTPTEELGLPGLDLDFIKGEREDLADKLDEPVTVKGPDFKGASLRGARLQNADLLTCSSIEGIYISDAQLDKTRLRRDQVSKVEHKMTTYLKGFFKNLVSWTLAAWISASEVVVIGEEREARSLRKGWVSEEKRDSEITDSETRRLVEFEAGESKYLYKEKLLQEELGDYIDESRALYFRKEKALYYREARHGYRVLKQNFNEFGNDRASSWAYLRERRMEKMEAYHEAWAALYEWKLLEAKWKRLRATWNFWKNFGKSARDLFVQLLCDYGENMRRVLASIFLIFLVFTGVYYFAGLESKDQLTVASREGGGFVVNLQENENTSASEVVTSEARRWDYPLFSLGAMTTMRPDELQPRQDPQWVKYGVEILARVETLSAIALTGLLGFVLGNRVRRR